MVSDCFSSFLVLAIRIFLVAFCEDALVSD